MRLRNAKTVIADQLLFIVFIVVVVVFFVVVSQKLNPHLNIGVLYKNKV